MALFNIGQDCQVVVIGPWGEIELPNETRFSYDIVLGKATVKPINGARETRTVFDSWNGEIMFARSSPAADAMAQQFQDSFLAGAMVAEGSIDFEIKEIDGSISAWRFTGVTFDFKSLGHFEADKDVVQSIQFEAKQRVKQ